ncbi:MAG TPA: class II fumarate hydratase [Planktothrix sp.]|jgi:fumarate hydratase class II
MKKSVKKRTERDSMGTMQVPAEAYYGASTQRAVINFPISNLRLQRSFIRALATIKLCAAEVNRRSRLLDGGKAQAIKRAAQEMAAGKFDKEFVVDVFQTGSGTSTNMNANEVIASRARELRGKSRGDRKDVHPNDDVNKGQSSNDVIPTATHIAAMLEINERLIPAMIRLEQSLRRKSEEFMPVIKTGRTHLQDATPIRLGQEFLGYAGQAERAVERLNFACQRLSQLALGGTAIGTGINTPPDFAAKVCAQLSSKLKFRVVETTNHFQAQSTMDEIVETSGVLKTIAASVMKIANDIRWLGSGPRAGFGEIALPEVQPGSSIMPGKVNPVIAEAVCQVAARLIGNDATITIAGQSGNFELNVMQPIAAYCLLESIEILATSIDNLAVRCIDGITATSRGPELVNNGLALATALVPAIGYDAAAAIAKEAAHTGESIKVVAKRMTSLSEEKLNELLDASVMTEAGSTLEASA